MSTALMITEVFLFITLSSGAIKPNMFREKKAIITNPAKQRNEQEELNPLMTFLLRL
jgi:hypothetical protein